MRCPTCSQHAPLLEPRVGKHGDLSRAQSCCRAGAASGSRSPETAPCASRRGDMAEQSRCARHGLPSAQGQGVRVHRLSGGAASRSDSTKRSRSKKTASPACACTLMASSTPGAPGSSSGSASVLLPSGWSRLYLCERGITWRKGAVRKNPNDHLEAEESPGSRCPRKTRR